MADQRIINAVAKVFKLDPSKVNDGSSIDTIEKWDSLGHLGLILELEAVFGLKLPSDDIPALTSVSRIDQKLRELGKISG